MTREFAPRIIAVAWAAPWSLIGLLFGLVTLLFGARADVHEGTLEFGGGRLGALLSRLPAPFGFCAITFGHVILGLDRRTLAAVRAHEQVHVRQYERWGPLFVPAYLLSSLSQLLKGRRPYLDNRFEREACSAAGQAASARPQRPTPNSARRR